MPRTRFVRELYTYPHQANSSDIYDFYLNFPAVQGSTLLENEDWHYPFWPTAAVYCIDSPHFHVEDIWHLHPYAKVPLLFEATGEIASHECYLTTTGDAERDPPESLDAPMASFWLKALEDESAQAERNLLVLRLWDIAQEAGADTEIIEFLSCERAQLRRGQASGASIQIFWGLTRKDGVRNITFYTMASSTHAGTVLNLSLDLTIPSATRLQRTTNVVPAGEFITGPFRASGPSFILPWAPSCSGTVAINHGEVALAIAFVLSLSGQVSVVHVALLHFAYSCIHSTGTL